MVGFFPLIKVAQFFPTILRVSEVNNVMVTKLYRKVHERTTLLFRRASDRQNHKTYFDALCLFCIFGFFGILIDLDHLVSRTLQSSRPLHLPYFILVGGICVCYSAYVFRLYRIGMKVIR